MGFMENNDKGNVREYLGKYDKPYGYGKESSGRKESVSGTHKVSITGRTLGVMTGVIDINEFDPEAVDINTTQGRLIIKGHELHVKRLNLEKGEADIEGNIDSLVYSSAKNTEPFLKKIFK